MARLRNLDSPITGARDLVGRFGHVAVLALLVSAAVLALNYGTNLALFAVDRAPIREHLRDAFASGDLALNEVRRGDSVMGSHQTNDCLIYDMAARVPDDPILFAFTGQRTGEVGRRGLGNCEMLRDWVTQDPMLQFTENNYLRYVHGYRAVAIGLLSLLPVAEARAVLKAVSHGGFVLVVAICAMLLLRRAGPLPAVARPQVAYALLAMAFLGFFGLSYFGQSASHAPSILVLALLLLWWCWADRAALPLRRSRMILAASVFGAATTVFEFLCGYLPVGASLLLALIAIARARPDVEAEAAPRTSAYGDAVLVLGAYLGTVVSTFAVHQVATAVALADKHDVIGNFFHALAARMSTSRGSAGVATGDTTTLTLGDVADNLLQNAVHIGLPDAVTAAGVLLALFGWLLLGLFICLGLARTAAERESAVLTFLVPMPVLAWYLLFQNHAFIHAQFMVRPLVVVPLAAVAMLWLVALRAGRALRTPQRQAQPAWS
ncbi:hypothetical protein [Zavarzinia sp. CC-PAN008]|uniref:hypothetical protein n=1 Tax=Zavarzinia sp. CC-PAN008 TaxID=3243332 RepID=UPI003F74777B